jgi:chaperonin GroES
MIETDACGAASFEGLAVTLIGTTALTPLLNWRKALLFREAVLWKIRHVHTGTKGPGAAGPLFQRPAFPQVFACVAGVLQIYIQFFALLLAKIFAQKALDGQKNDIKLPLNLPSGGVKNFFNLRRGIMATKIRPLHDRVIVKRLQDEEKTKGGLIIPDTAKEKPQQGTVVAIGPGKQEDGKVISLDVKAGDKILFGKYSGTEIKLDGEEHLILREDDILGVIE